jgi:HSP20 family protein
MMTLWSDFDPTFNPFDDFRRRVDRLFDQYQGAGARPAPGPRLALTDEGDSLLFTADLPGMGESDVQLSLKDELLTLTAERKVTAPEGSVAHRREREAFKLTRSVVLPCRVDPERASATFKDGVLRVQLAKSEAEKPRQIAIKTK